MISRKPKMCHCGFSRFDEHTTFWQCGNCGKNFGKAIAKVWVEQEINGKMEKTRMSSLRPDGKMIKRVDIHYSSRTIKSETIEKTKNSEIVIQREIRPFSFPRH